MVQNAFLEANLRQIADEVARSLSFAEVSGHSAFITTPVTYANGTAVVVRLDADADGYFVSDDGYGAFTAETMGALQTFVKVAGGVAKRSGVEFDHRSFFIIRVEKDRLPAAVAAIANVSAAAVDRTIYALENMKVKRSRVLFQARLEEAFGSKARFDVPVRGATREWDFAGVIQDGNGIAAVFEFVAPAFSAVASANMKLGDVRGLTDAPSAIAALADYERTEPALRAVLSNTADKVIAVGIAAEEYRQAA